MTGIWDRPIDDTPVAVIDFETTGLYPGRDRVIEAAVIRVDPGDEPRVAFDSLIRPGRPVAATFVHGITDADVADAPAFADVAGEFLRALSGCVLAAYNARFDMSFLDYELGALGEPSRPPHLCLMYLRPLLNLGKVCRLGVACQLNGVRLSGAHSAAGDALASARLWQRYQNAIRDRGITTFRELAGAGRYQFLRSFDRPPIERRPRAASLFPAAPKSRFRGVA